MKKIWVGLFQDACYYISVKRELEAEAAATAASQKNTEVEVRLNFIYYAVYFKSFVTILQHRERLKLWFIFTFKGSNVPQKDPSSYSVSGVYFICPLTGKTLTKSERELHIKEAILMVSLQTWQDLEKSRTWDLDNT